MRTLNKFLLFAIFLTSNSLFAWSNHGLSTYVALRNTELQKAPKVKVEKLEDFLEAEKVNLSGHLQKIENRIKELGLQFTDVPQKFNPELKDAELKESFLHSLRVNTRVHYGLYLQDIPSANTGSRPKIPAKQISLIEDISLARKHLLVLKDKEDVEPLLVVSTYVDEPDFGMDIGLFEDVENSPEGKLYGFGKIPFGNPRLEYATQAPFHMAFFYELPTTYWAKQSIKRTFPDTRILQYRELSAYAFKTGHPYWGYRFAAWALHYIQDLSQPYHSSLVPGASEWNKIVAAVLAMASFTEKQDKLINEITNLHVAVEDYQFTHLAKNLEEGKEDAVLIKPLETSTHPLATLNLFNHIKSIVAKTSFKEAKNLRDALASAIAPSIYLSNDPGKIDYHNLIENLDEKRKAALYKELSVLMSHLGQHTRDFILNLQTTSL